MKTILVLLLMIVPALGDLDAWNNSTNSNIKVNSVIVGTNTLTHDASMPQLPLWNGATWPLPSALSADTLTLTGWIDISGGTIPEVSGETPSGNNFDLFAFNGSGDVGLNLFVASSAKTSLAPTAADGTVAYKLDTSNDHSSGILAYIANHGTNKLTVSWDGISTAVNGLSSTATDTAVTIAATGWTNTFGKNTVVYINGTAATYTIANNAGTVVVTNSIVVGNTSTAILQTGGKLIVTAGTAISGRAVPW